MQSKKSTENAKVETKAENNTPAAKTGDKDGEIYAAIAMALHEELGNVHDDESGILTIARNTSEWNAKHQMLRK